MLGAQVGAAALIRGVAGEEPACSTLTPRSATSARKSSTVTWWMFCVSYQLTGKCRVTGMRPSHSSDSAHPPVREVGEADERLAPDPQQFVEHQVGPLGGLQRLAEDRVVERAVGIIGQVAVGVALDHRQARARRTRSTSAGSISMPRASTPLLVAQRRHQRAVAAADIEHARARRDVGGDHREVGRARRGSVTVEEPVDHPVERRHVEQEAVVAVRAPTARRS